MRRILADGLPTLRAKRNALEYVKEVPSRKLTCRNNGRDAEAFLRAALARAWAFAYVDGLLARKVAFRHIATYTGWRGPVAFSSKIFQAEDSLEDL